MASSGKTLRCARLIFVPALVAVLLYWTALFLLQRKIIFPAESANSRLDTKQEVGAGIPDLERFWIETEDGKTEYWLQLASGASAESPAALVIFTHGNAELLDGQAWVFEGFRRLGYSVAMCEYRGYGRSSGGPSQAAIARDHRAMLEALLERPEIDGKRIVYFGRSVGTGVACSLIEIHEPTAIVLLSPFQSLRSMAAGFLAPAFLVRDPFDNEESLSRYRGPLLLMHGVRDAVIPFEHSLSLQNVAPQSQLARLECGHNDVPVESMEFWRLVEQFLTSAN